MSRLDGALVRILSADRQGLLHGTKNPKIYLSLGGTAAKPTFSMRTLPDINGPTNKVNDPGMGWFLNRIPRDDPNVDPPEDTWTMHNMITGSKMCLERVDTKTGELKMAPLVKGSKAQQWSLEAIDVPGRENVYYVQAEKRQETGLMGAPGPARLDVNYGTDKVVARVIRGSPVDEKGRPYVEGTGWEVVVLRMVTRGDEAGVGWANAS